MSAAANATASKAPATKEVPDEEVEDSEAETSAGEDDEDTEKAVPKQFDIKDIRARLEKQERTNLIFRACHVEAKGRRTENEEQEKLAKELGGARLFKGLWYFIWKTTLDPEDRDFLVSKFGKPVTREVAKQNKEKMDAEGLMTPALKAVVAEEVRRRTGKVITPSRRGRGGNRANMGNRVPQRYQGTVGLASWGSGGNPRNFAWLSDGGWQTANRRVLSNQGGFASIGRGADGMDAVRAVSRCL